MKTSRAARFLLMNLNSAVARWAATLLTMGLTGGFCFLSAADAPESAMPPAAVLALTAVGGIAVQQSRARARRRLQSALDAYAEREIALSGKRRTAVIAVKALPDRDGFQA